MKEGWTPYLDRRIERARRFRKVDAPLRAFFRRRAAQSSVRVGATRASATSSLVVVHELVNVLDEVQVPTVGGVDPVLGVHADRLLVEGVQMRLGGGVRPSRSQSSERGNTRAPHRGSAEEDARAAAVAARPQNAHAGLHRRRPRTVTPARLRERSPTATVPVISFVVTEVLHHYLELLLDLVVIDRHGGHGHASLRFLDAFTLHTDCAGESRCPRTESVG